MGNTCSCIDSNPSEAKIAEIDEIVYNRRKFESGIIEDRLITPRSFSVAYSPIFSKSVMVKSQVRRYLTLKFLSSSRIFKSFAMPHKVIYGDLPTAPEIKEIEKSLDSLQIIPKNTDTKVHPVIELPEGGYYQGPWDFETEKQEGFGIMVHSDQSKYIGCFKEGKKSGKGCMIRMDGEISAGDFLNDYLEGIGIQKKSNGLVYKGEFKKGKEQGQGVLESNGEVIYEGSFMKGMKHGKGKLCLQGGNMYIGDFVENLLEGQGTYVWNDGKEYKGSWKKNKMHGIGAYFWPDGRQYQGSYVDGNRDGYGIFKWQDGREYRGEWVNGNMHGIGVYTFMDKNGELVTIKAMWENGKKIKILS